MSYRICNQCGYEDNFERNIWCDECGSNLMDSLTRQISNVNERDEELFAPNNESPLKWRSQKDGAKKLMSKDDIDDLEEKYKYLGKIDYLHSDEYRRDVNKIKEQVRKEAFKEAKDTIANSLQNAGFSGGAVNMVKNNIQFI